LSFCRNNTTPYFHGCEFWRAKDGVLKRRRAYDETLVEVGIWSLVSLPIHSVATLERSIFSYAFDVRRREFEQLYKLHGAAIHLASLAVCNHFSDIRRKRSLFVFSLRPESGNVCSGCAASCSTNGLRIGSTSAARRRNFTSPTRGKGSMRVSGSRRSPSPFNGPDRPLQACEFFRIYARRAGPIEIRRSSASHSISTLHKLGSSVRISEEFDQETRRRK
jgi:hypothetical protein